MAARPGKTRRGKRKLNAVSQQRREEVVRHVLAMMPLQSIAKTLGIHRNQVAEIIAEPEVQSKLAEARATAFRDAQAVLRQGTRRAAAVLIELLEDDAGHVRARAAIEILSKAGADAPKKIDLGVLAGATDEELWDRLHDLEAGKAPAGG